MHESRTFWRAKVSIFIANQLTSTKLVAAALETHAINVSCKAKSRLLRPFIEEAGQVRLIIKPLNSISSFTLKIIINN